jgi:glycosyltransferase involved in cell wall biosynthesis
VKLAYLVSQYPTINHTFILREIRALRQQGFDIDVISVRPPDRSIGQLSPVEQEEAARTTFIRGAPWDRIVAAHLITVLRRPAGYLRGLAEALRMGRFHPRTTLRHLLYFAEAVAAGHWIMARNLSHLHTHFSSTVGVLLVRIFPLTMSITIHGSGEFNDPAGFHLVSKVAAARFVCTISHFGHSQLMRICNPSLWDRIEVARLGVDPTAFTPRPFRESPEVFEILCVAGLVQGKAQRVLIDAVHHLVRQGRKARLHLVGDGADRGALEASVASLDLKDAVVFHGWLNQEQVREIYRQTDVFALASFAEGIPVVLMEAMAMEIPCVATYVGGVPELIQDGVTGLLAPASDVGSLAGALARLMDDGALRKQLGAAGRLKVLRDFDLDRNTTHLAQIIRRRVTSCIP